MGSLFKFGAYGAGSDHVLRAVMFGVVGRMQILRKFLWKIVPLFHSKAFRLLPFIFCMPLLGVDFLFVFLSDF